MAPPLKVVYMIHDSRRSGVPAVVANLVRALDRSRVTPSILFAYDGIYAGELRDDGLEVRSWGKRLPVLWRLNRFLFNLYLLKLAKRADIVHINSTKLVPSVFIAKWLGATVILHLHEKAGKIGRILVKAMGFADCVVFCAKNCAEHYAQVPAVRKRTILNAVRVPGDVSSPPDTAKPKIVMFGSINKNKGQDLLLRALALLDNKEAELYFYGTVGLSAHGFVRGLKKFVTDKDLSDRVFFPGPTHEADKVFQQATLLVHSSLNECMSISVLEALSYGIPVIANDITGMDEIISHGINGFLVPPGDVQALADRIDQLLENPGLREAMGQAGRAAVAEKFDMAKRAEEFMALYRELT